MLKPLSRKRVFGLLLTFLAACNTAFADDIEKILYVAPKEAGDGRGESQADAAYFRDNLPVQR